MVLITPLLVILSSIQADMDFEDCLTASCFSDQQVTSSLTLLIYGPWFSPAHVEVGGGVAYSYLHTGVKLVRRYNRENSSRLLERCYNDIASFIILVQRGPRSRDATFHFPSSTSRRFNLHSSSSPTRSTYNE